MVRWLWHSSVSSIQEPLGVLACASEVLPQNFPLRLSLHLNGKYLSNVNFGGRFCKFNCLAKSQEVGLVTNPYHRGRRYFPRVAEEWILAVFDIPHVRCRHCVSTAELRRRLRLTSILAQLIQGKLRWFGHVARRPNGEPIRDLHLPNTALHLAQAD